VLRKGSKLAVPTVRPRPGRVDNGACLGAGCGLCASSGRLLVTIPVWNDTAAPATEMTGDAVHEAVCGTQEYRGLINVG